MARQEEEALFVARLNAAGKVATVGAGVAVLMFDADQQRLQAGVTVSNLNQITAASLHLGRPDRSGPAVAVLYDSAYPVNAGLDTALVNRTLTADDLTGPLAGKGLSTLFQQIKSGNAYVNVQTARHPQGEIRGKLIRPK